MVDFRHLSGATSELYVAYRLSELGYMVSRPFITQSEYDLVIEKDQKFYSVQVKKASWSKSGLHSYLQCRLSRDKTRLDATVDLFAFTDNKNVWVVTTGEIKGMTSVCLGSSNPEYISYKRYDPEIWKLT